MSPVVKKRVLLAAGASVAAAVAIVIVVVASSSDQAGRTDAASGVGDRVKLELRASTRAMIRMNGTQIGTTPKTLVVPRSSAPIELEATFTIEKYGVRKAAKKTETWVLRRSVVPDAEQSVDFNFAEATKIGEGVEAPSRSADP